MIPQHLNSDQTLRLECLRICINVAEAKNAYFWINDQAQKQAGQQSAQNHGGQLGAYGSAQANMSTKI